jgi:hypothetical protein
MLPAQFNEQAMSSLGEWYNIQGILREILQILAEQGRTRLSQKGTFLRLDWLNYSLLGC